MAQQWQVEHAKGRCAVSGRLLEEGEPFYSVLFEEGETFRRADYSLDSWTGPPEGCFCCFKSRVPVREKRKKLFVDDEMLVEFFRRLESETEPARVQFRFVLALILMRKRILRYEGSALENGVDVWQMTLLRDQSVHKVANPQLSDDQIAGVSEQLTAILHSDVGDFSHQPAPAVSEQVAESSAQAEVAG